ncbi:hypothetical protein [Paraburkholderia aromaticivorans]|uniref:hypothetical protein n=1 Tax=Paraburkholderia aromaticivorans TaxID=2026199 RepID=UPI001455EEA1|nr:hypothetical protein [Paraburkholderia aromaticivorans]
MSIVEGRGVAISCVPDATDAAIGMRIVTDVNAFVTCARDSTEPRALGSPIVKLPEGTKGVRDCGTIASRTLAEPSPACC